MGLLARRRRRAVPPFFLYASRALHDPHAPALPGLGRARGVVRPGRTGSGSPTRWCARTRRRSTTSRPGPARSCGTRTAGGSCSTPAPRLTEHGANVQSIGYAISSDLITWDKAPGPVLAADARWYEKSGRRALARRGVPRPVGVRRPGRRRLAHADHGARPTTARTRSTAGVVGHAWSADLGTWELRPPLSQPGQGFGQLEVMQPFVVDGRQVLLFNCLVGDMPEAARAEWRHRRRVDRATRSRRSGPTTSPAPRRSTTRRSTSASSSPSGRRGRRSSSRSARPRRRLRRRDHRPVCRHLGRRPLGARSLSAAGSFSHSTHGGPQVSGRVSTLGLRQPGIEVLRGPAW